MRLRFDRFRGFVEEYSANLSLGGMFIRSDEPVPVGTELPIEFRLGEDYELITGRGRVAWVRSPEQADEEHPPGLGIRFLELTPGSRELIFRMVERRVREGGDPFDLEEAADLLPERPPEPGPGPEVRFVPAEAGEGDTAATPFASLLNTEPPGDPEPLPEPPGRQRPEAKQGAAAGAGGSAAAAGSAAGAAAGAEAATEGEDRPGSQGELPLGPAAGGDDGSVAAEPTPAGREALPGLDDLPSLEELDEELEELDPLDPPVPPAALEAPGAGSDREEEAGGKPVSGSATPPEAAFGGFAAAAGDEGAAGGFEATDAASDFTAGSTDPAHPAAQTETAAGSGEVGPFGSPGVDEPPAAEAGPVGPFGSPVQEPEEVGEGTGGFGGGSFADQERWGGYAAAPAGPAAVDHPAAAGEGEAGEDTVSGGSYAGASEGRSSGGAARWLIAVVVLLAVAGVAAAWWYGVPPFAGGDEAMESAPSAVEDVAAAPDDTADAGPSRATGTASPPAGDATSPEAGPPEPAVDPPAADPRDPGATSTRPSRRSQPAAAGRRARRIEDVRFVAEDGATLVLVRADQPLQASDVVDFRLDGGDPRHVVRLLGIEEPYGAGRLAVGTDELRQVRSGLHGEAGERELHLVLDLAAPGVRVRSIETLGDRLRIEVAGGGGDS